MVNLQFFFHQILSFIIFPLHSAKVTQNRLRNTILSSANSMSWHISSANCLHKGISSIHFEFSFWTAKCLLWALLRISNAFNIASLLNHAPEFLFTRNRFSSASSRSQSWLLSRCWNAISEEASETGVKLVYSQWCLNAARLTLWSSNSYGMRAENPHIWLELQIAFS